MPLRNTRPTPEAAFHQARKEGKEKLAGASRMAIRHYRNTGDTDSLVLHGLCKAELIYLECPQFGLTGWDDALTSPEFPGTWPHDKAADCPYSGKGDVTCRCQDQPND